MAVQLVLRKGTDEENDAFTGANAEVTVDVTNKTLRVHDGTTTGGFHTASLVGTQTLSNKILSSPTFSGEVTGDLIPSDDVTYDLGSSSNRWKDLFLSGNTIDIGGATISVVSGSFEFKDSAGNDAEVSLSGNDTDDLSEGSTNLYYTDTRARNAVSAGGDLSYDSSTGTFSYDTPYTEQSSQPSNPNPGDEWFDDVNKIYFKYLGGIWTKIAEQNIIATESGDSITDEDGNILEYV